ncbi:hypothetical protein ACQ86N_32960 [Puia sp. P3]|uniref:hypothetical protein n=1 Tax=Puia sp. P3 TaxID=3423952 RepID=UPI003D67AE3E
MLNQKDNDFDDLFRRASERYPLRTDSADWDRMAAALDNPSSTELTDEGVIEEKRRRRRFLWLFLLLPLGGQAITSCIPLAMALVDIPALPGMGLWWRGWLVRGIPGLAEAELWRRGGYPARFGAFGSGWKWGFCACCVGGDREWWDSGWKGCGWEQRGREDCGWKECGRKDYGCGDGSPGTKVC